MKKILFSVVAAASVFAMAPAQAAQIINLDGRANASSNGSVNTVDTLLTAGTYTLSFVSAQSTHGATHTAFSRWSSNAGCDAGEACRQGWENSAKYIIGGTTYSLGDGNGSGGYGPLAEGGYYNSAALSFANSGGYSAQFTLTADTLVKFFISDNQLNDNRGGVSLALTQSAVPEPTTWAFMIFGLAAVGATMRRSKVQVSFA